MESTRYELYRKKREQINRELEISLKAEKNSEKVQSYINKINNLNSKVLTNDIFSDVKIRSVEIIDKTNNATIDLIKEHNDNINLKKLGNFNKEYEQNVVKNSEKKSFEVNSNNIILNLPVENTPYLKYEAELQQVQSYNIKEVNLKLQAKQELTKINEIISIIKKEKNYNNKDVSNLEKIQWAEKELVSLNVKEYEDYLSKNLFSEVTFHQKRIKSKIKLRKYLIIFSTIIFFLLFLIIVFFILYAQKTI